MVEFFALLTKRLRIDLYFYFFFAYSLSICMTMMIWQTNTLLIRFFFVYSCLWHIFMDCFGILLNVLLLLFFLLIFSKVNRMRLCVCELLINCIYFNDWLFLTFKHFWSIGKCYYVLCQWMMNLISNDWCKLTINYRPIS